jgi:NAD(P)-dependent dehydrogenase (short-subunit alcohol dehydrogenase family)
MNDSFYEGRRPTALITGAARGLGAELARQYAATGWRVIACCRDPEAAPEGASIEPLLLELASRASIAALTRDLAGRPIDLLVNNAAVRGDTGGLPGLTPDDFLEVMRVNVLGPLMLVRELLPNLEAGRGRVVANIGSTSGSIAEGVHDEGDYAYRCSKAALNMATAKLAHDLRPRGIVVLSLHPGWVRTDMGGPGALLDAAESAAGLRRVIEAATLADSGSFRRWDGSPIAW